MISTDGKHRVLLTTAKHRNVKIAGLGPGAKATVSVTCYAVNGCHGASVVAHTST